MNNRMIELNGVTYTVFENGDVYNGSRKITQRPSYKDGYACFTCGKKGCRRTIKTHRIVGKLFIDNPQNLPELDHLDGNRMNPNVTNLEWVTHQENIKRAQLKGKYRGISIGINNNRAKLDDNTVKNIRYDFANGLSQQEISTKYQTPWSTIHNVVTYQTWKHVI